jgi:hypothetical protein
LLVPPSCQLQVTSYQKLPNSRYYYICPTAWTLYGITVTQLGDLTDVTMTLSAGGTTTVAEYVTSVFDFEYGMRGWAAAALVGFVAVFWGASMAAIAKLNFQKR